MLAKSTTYEFSIQEIQNLIATQLNVKPENVIISAIEEEQGDDRFGPTYKVFKGIKAKINQPINVSTVR